MDITLGKIASWTFGILFILAGLGTLTSSVPAGLVYLLTGLFLIPNVRQEIDERYDVAFSRWVVVIIAVIGMGLGGALMAGNMDSTQPAMDDTNPQEENPDNADQTADRESRTHAVGDEFTVGDVRYRVNDVSTTQQIGETVGGTLMGVEANGQFMIVDLTVMNEADQSIRMTTSSVKLLLDEREYGANTEASVYMENSFSFEQLNPGVQVEGQIAYDVPSSASADTVELEVGPVGVFSTAEPHYVDLGA